MSSVKIALKPVNIFFFRFS